MFGYDFHGTERFQVLSCLGAGGMGVVYEVMDHVRDERVALKTIRNLSAESLLRFKNEYRALQDLRHPNLVALGEMFESGGEWFFTMELVQGIDFVSFVRGTSGRLLSQVPPQSTTSSASMGFEETAAGSRGGGEFTVFDRRPTAASAAAPSLLPGQCDDGRLRSALGQLAGGLCALHRAGMVHRDIKPSNILVRPDGHVVLLDFGLVRNVLTSHQSATNLVGTIAYMAPEQALGKAVGPEADWYSVGVMAYEAITGQLPFSGNPLDVLVAKQQLEVAPPSVLVPDLSPDLDALCADLLRPDAVSRPSGHEVLRRLGEDEGELEPSGVWSIPTEQTGPPFVGRLRELDELGHAFTESREHTLAVVVTGPSGIGKSCLVQQFTSRMRLRHPSLLVLSGRCHERESIPFKAFDGVVDMLSRYLAKLPTSEMVALLPEHATLLGQVFPVLRSVSAIVRASPPSDAGGALEKRGHLFAAMRELLVKLAARQQVIITIDDLQWADADSWALLEHVMREPDAPHLLLLATRRLSAGMDVKEDGYLPIEGNVRVTELRPLPHDEITELAAQLLLASGVPRPKDAEAIATEAAGNPLFVDELVRQVLPQRPGAARPKLEGALWRRISVMAEPVRRLLEYLVVAGARVPQGVAARAAGLSPSEHARHVSTLRAASLVHSGEGGAVLEVSHDRIREAVLQHLDPAQQRACHERLAVAFEAQTPPDAQALYRHWVGAGSIAKAAHFAALAGDQAAAALAFDRAISFYQRALEAGVVEEPARRDGPPAKLVDRRALRLKLADALARAGRAREAAMQYLEAGRDGDVAESHELRRMAAEQLLRGGHVDEAYEQLGAVLPALGLPFPETDRASLWLLLRQRLLLRLGGTRFRERRPEDMPLALRRRIDLTWSMGLSLSWIDPIRGAAYDALSLRLSLRSGDPARVARALAVSAVHEALASGSRDERARATLRRANQLAEHSESAYARGLTAAAEGLSSYLVGDFRQAQQSSARAAEVFAKHCAGKTLELTQARVTELWSLYHLGQMAELVRRIPPLHREAQERGDIMAAAALRSTVLNAALLASNDPERAARHLGRVMGRWSNQGFHVEHYWELVAHVQIDLYRGDGARAHARIVEGWPHIVRSRLLHAQHVAAEAHSLRARAALAAAAAFRPSAPERPRLLAQARESIARVRKAHTRCAAPLADLLLGGLSFTEGIAETCLDHTRRALEGFEALEMSLFAAVCRVRIGQLVQGPEGTQLIDQADEWMHGQKIKNPPAFARMLAPGFQA